MVFEAEEDYEHAFLVSRAVVALVGVMNTARLRRSV